MKTLFLDFGMGVSGDMFAGALFDLVPCKTAALEAFNSFGIPGVVFEAETVFKCGIKSVRLSVKVDGATEEPHGHIHGASAEPRHSRPGHHAHRTLAEITELIDALSIPPDIASSVKSVYGELAAAESRAHGKSVGEIHFHETGTADAIADIAASCWLVDAIAPDEIISTPVRTGYGWVRCAHGELPVPAPATAFLLEGMPSYAGEGIEAELCTPTGAALARRFVRSFGVQPQMAVSATGYGAGRMDFARANVLRAVLGERTAEGASPCEETMYEIKFDVDDMTGEEIALASEMLFAAGARDVAVLPAFMKKGRPGHMFSVLCAPAEKDAVMRTAFANTSTIGLRECPVLRHAMARKTETAGGIRFKISEGYGTAKTKPESDDVAAAVRAARMPGLWT